MRNAKKLLESFIDEIPATRLENFPPSSASNPIYSNVHFRLDMQGITSDGKFNLQVQVNKQTTCSTLKIAGAATVAGPVLVDPEDPITPEEVRKKFHSKSRL
ncbi:uncharacterized protein B0J16DRAFT_322232 [Fusarium flagelliforme]|uniref:uncharacterized protein n=1 Tax=Fusarium flagelliforme TaxID=2675880 RepID=UPI001E8EB59D|nr:uncharacterized protein B0J16DRAFT_322232 [Fusarium flagelliforme]KAH7183493.1 hypothetical protein B0J16DRAFT_322232 [Fusarium flagelliforme]